MGCRSSLKLPEQTTWERRVFVELRRYSEIESARETLRFLKKKRVRLVFKDASPNGITQGRYDPDSRVVTLRGTFPNKWDDLKSKERTILASALVVHEIRHARDLKSGLPVACWETEVLASIEQTIFDWRRVIHSGGDRLSEINERLSPDACSPWWNCPIELENARALALVELWKSNEESDRIAEWLAIRVLAGGVENFFKYHSGIHSLNPDDGFLPSIETDPRRVIPVLAALEQQWARYCASSSADVSECAREQSRWSRQHSIWKSQNSLSRIKRKISKAIETAKERVREGPLRSNQE